MWNTTKVQFLFPLKDSVDHYSYVIYKEDCSCDQNYIGEKFVMPKCDQPNPKIRIENEKQFSI